MTSLFAGLKNAKVSERGVFINEGQYKVRVVKALMKHVRKGYDAFILEFKVEESNYSAVKKLKTEGVTLTPADLEALEKTLPNKPGTTASWFQSLADQDIGFGALKGFAAAVMGEDPNNPEFIEQVEQFLTEVVNGSDDEIKLALKEKRPPNGALNGCLLPLEAVIITTKKGEPFTLYRFGKLIDEAS